MPESLQQFYQQTVRYHLEDALIEAISKIVRINKHGVKSLSNDVAALADSGIKELTGMARVKRYIELMSH